MRATLPLALAVSLAAHLLIAGGVALSCYGGTSRESEKIEETPTLTLVRPEFTPVRPLVAPVAAKRADFHPVTMSQPARQPAASLAHTSSPLPTADEPGLPVPARSAPALEANPNAHLPTAAPEAVLCPVPPPNLDGTRGVVFMLDISGSMYEPYGGTTRLTRAREALSRRVRALPDGTPFAVVLYAQRACPSGPLVAANEATREAAVRFLMRDVDCGGGTNLPAGLSAGRALRTGALVLATDGDLNISIPSLMLESREILGGMGRGPSIAVIGIAPRSGTPDERILQDLADQQGGSYAVEGAADETVQR